ncbi:MAG: hypothetical protein RBQ77_02680 [Candidatus Methanomethylophilaceae archaeon]|jgi:GNAT superfamily N-acetyltransferase|nr:hypothetical protein [Candidatus Methanomethylophilaceae archaeon]
MTAYRRLEPGDVPRVMGISVAELGPDYLSERRFLEAMDSAGCFCNVATEDGEAVAFALCRLFGPDSIGEAMGLPASPELERLSGLEAIGLLDSVSVLDSMKGRGIGTRISEISFRQLAEGGARAVCAMAWRTVAGRTNIAGTLEGLGMRESLSIEGYWNGRVDTPGGHMCPVCGAPCGCYGVLYTAFL